MKTLSLRNQNLKRKISSWYSFCALFVLVIVIVFDIRPNVRGFEPDRQLQPFKGDKILGTTSLGEEVQLSGLYCKILRHFKETQMYKQRYLWAKLTGISCQVPPSSLLGASAATRAENSSVRIGSDQNSDGEPNRSEKAAFAWDAWYDTTP